MFTSHFKKKIHTVEAPVVPQDRSSDAASPYLKPLVAWVEEHWEVPPAEQYEHSYQGYLEEITDPIEGLEDRLEEKELLLRLKVQRMIEIAPDLFEKALRCNGVETQYFIAKEPV